MAPGIKLGDDVKRVIIHTHPTPTGPSAFDFDMLRQLGQQSSRILEIGAGVTKFTRP